MRISDWSSDVCSSDLGGETLVEYADRSGETLIAQVRIKLRQVGGHHQALVDDVLVGEAANVEGAVVGERDFGAAACEEQLDAELAFVQAIAGDKDLLDPRQTIKRKLTQHEGIDWHFTPADPTTEARRVGKECGRTGRT